MLEVVPLISGHVKHLNLGCYRVKGPSDGEFGQALCGVMVCSTGLQHSRSCAKGRITEGTIGKTLALRSYGNPYQNRRLPSGDCGDGYLENQPCPDTCGSHFNLRPESVIQRTQ